MTRLNSTQLARSRRPADAVRAYVVAALLASLLVGCRSPLGLFTSKKTDEYPELAGTEEISGPLGRLVRWRKQERDSAAGAFLPPEGQEEYDQAQKLVEAEDYKTAEKQLKKITKKYKDSPIREDALFLLGETQFHQKRYAAAQDSFDLLLKDYQATRHIDTVSRRYFAIAREWLGFHDVDAAGDVQTAGLEDGGDAAPADAADDEGWWQDPSLAVPIVPNLADRTRPLFDTQGRALEALKKIWINDVTGPLADDALMLTAAYHLKKQNYLEADRIFGILREQYPKSPHLQNAFVLGSHVKLMSYQGALYDGKALEEARQLKESALRLFPDGVDRERLTRELKLADEARAHRQWEMVEYWLKRRNPRGAVIYCENILRDFPRSRYAEHAREKLAELSPGHHLARTDHPPQELPEDNATPLPNSDYDAGRQRLERDRL